MPEARAVQPTHDRDVVTSGRAFVNVASQKEGGARLEATSDVTVGRGVALNFGCPITRAATMRADAAGVRRPRTPPARGWFQLGPSASPYPLEERDIQQVLRATRGALVQDEVVEARDEKPHLIELGGYRVREELFSGQPAD